MKGHQLGWHLVIKVLIGLCNPLYSDSWVGLKFGTINDIANFVLWYGAFLWHRAIVINQWQVKFAPGIDQAWPLCSKLPQMLRMSYTKWCILMKPKSYGSGQYGLTNNPHMAHTSILVALNVRFPVLFLKGALSLNSREQIQKNRVLEFPMQ